MTKIVFNEFSHQADKIKILDINLKLLNKLVNLSTVSNTNLNFGCNLVSCKIRIGFLGTVVQNSSAKEKIYILNK